MGTYVPNTPEEQLEMLRAAGFESFDDMFSCIPDEVKLGKELNLPPGMSELELSAEMTKLAGANKVFSHIICNVSR